MARILQLSDLHVVAPGSLASGILDTSALLKDAVDFLLPRLDAIGPIDAVLVTGDISDDGNEASYEAARAELGRLGRPLLVIPGNHDRRDGLRAAFADQAGMPRSGPIDWVADMADARVIGLDTLVEGRGGGRLQRTSLSFLADALHTAGGKPVVVALHHPPLRTGIRFMDTIGLENSADLAAVLARHEGTLRVVAGHVHGIYHSQIGGHPVSTALSVCSAFALDGRHDAPVGFMTGPTGCVVFDTAPEGIWTAIPFYQGEGPFPFGGAAPVAREPGGKSETDIA